MGQPSCNHRYQLICVGDKSPNQGKNSNLGWISLASSSLNIPSIFKFLVDCVVHVIILSLSWRAMYAILFIEGVIKVKYSYMCMPTFILSVFVRQDVMQD